MTSTRFLTLALVLIASLVSFPRIVIADEVESHEYLRLPVVREDGDPEDYYDDCVRQNRGAEGRCEAATVSFFKLDDAESAVQESENQIPWE